MATFLQQKTYVNDVPAGLCNVILGLALADSTAINRTVPVFGVIEGYFAVLWSVDNSDGDTAEFQTIFVTMPAGSTYPAREFIKGWTYYYFSTMTLGGLNTGFPDWTEAWSLWQDVFIVKYVEFLETYCGCDCDIGVPYQTSAFGGNVHSSTWGVRIDLGAEALTQGFTFVGQADSWNGSFQELNYGFTPTVTPVVQVASAGQPLARIESALEALAMSRIEVSANNGDSMFNIVGGTRAESE